MEWHRQCTTWEVVLSKGVGDTQSNRSVGEQLRLQRGALLEKIEYLDELLAQMDEIVNSSQRRIEETQRLLAKPFPGERTGAKP